MNAARRRSVIVRAGLLAIFAATAIACIFDKGGFEGGGRKDSVSNQGDQAQTSSSASGTSTTPPPTDAGGKDTSSPVDAPAG